MMRSGILLSMVVAAAATGCKSGGARDLSEAPNAVEREYARTVDPVWQATTRAMQNLRLNIQSDRHDRLGGTLVAQRATGETVTVNAMSAGERATSVAVQVEGAQRNLAELVHSEIARELGTTAGDTGFFGGNTTEGQYDAAFAQAVLAAERAFEELRMEVTRREIKEGTAELVARKYGGESVLVRLERPQGQPQADGQQPPQANGQRQAAPRAGQETSGPLKATFVAGTSRSGDNDALARSVKQTFERFLQPGVR